MVPLLGLLLLARATHSAAPPFDVYWAVGTQGWKGGGEPHCPPADWGAQWGVSLPALGVLPPNLTNVGDDCCCAGCQRGYFDDMPSIMPTPWRTQRSIVPHETQSCVAEGDDVTCALPQQVNMTKHLAVVRAGVARWVPDPDWQGNAVLDFEEWSAVWDWNVSDPLCALGGLGGYRGMGGG